MNIQLNPDQLLVLYNLVTTSASETKIGSQKQNLLLIKTKIEEVMKDALDKAFLLENKEKMSSWFKQEEQRIDDLKADLQKIKTTAVSKNSIENNHTIDDGLHFPPQV